MEARYNQYNLECYPQVVSGSGVLVCKALYDVHLKLDLPFACFFLSFRRYQFKTLGRSWGQIHTSKHG